MLGANVPVSDAEYLWFIITKLIFIQKAFPRVTTCATAKQPTSHFSGCTSPLSSPNLLYFQKRWKERGSSQSDEAAAVTTNAKGTKSSCDQPCALACSLSLPHSHHSQEN